MYILLEDCTPELITMKQTKVTSTDVTISWSAPTKGSGQEEMFIDQYYVQYQIGPVRQEHLTTL